MLLIFATVSHITFFLFSTTTTSHLACHCWAHCECPMGQVVGMVPLNVNGPQSIGCHAQLTIDCHITAPPSPRIKPPHNVKTGDAIDNHHDHYWGMATSSHDQHLIDSLKMMLRWISRNWKPWYILMMSSISIANLNTNDFLYPTVGPISLLGFCPIIKFSYLLPK